jgi:hypothetical protein
MVCVRMRARMRVTVRVWAGVIAVLYDKSKQIKYEPVSVNVL